MENIGDNSQAQSVVEAMQRLPADCTAVLSMRYYGNLRNAEIGEILGISARNVQRRIARAIRILREEIKK